MGVPMPATPLLTPSAMPAEKCKLTPSREVALLKRAKPIAAVLAALCCAGAAAADPVADFYKGKQITLLIGSDPGGGFDAYARLVGRHIGSHIPGHPTIVPSNQPGAGSLTMTNSLVKNGPFDGTVIGAPQSSALVEKLLHVGSPGGKAAHFDPVELNWLGSASQDVFVLFDWHSSKIESFADVMKRPMLVGSANPNTDGSLIATALDKLLDAKIKLVTGYQSTPGELLAMQQGETDGDVMAYASIVAMHPDWVRNDKIRILAQMANEPQPGLERVPFVLNLVGNERDRAILRLIFTKFQVGRPLFAPPGTPADRVVALRAAFDATMTDPAFLADAQQVGLTVRSVTGKDVQAIVERIYRTPDSLAAQARDVLGTK
jgi:tripartite-type tricarboxylate transporter receptor subunit TctC